MLTPKVNALVVLGPTASGKTTLGVHLAHALGGEVISADSRQVYRGLDIGSGKDLQEYFVEGEPVPYHLIDLVDLSTEFSVFDYQRAFRSVWEEVKKRRKLPVIVGGTGLYLESVLEGYAMVEVPENPELRERLDALPDTVLREQLLALRPHLHNTTDLLERDRLVRALEIASAPAEVSPTPLPLSPLILGTQWPRDVLRARIGARLKDRLSAGLIEEVERLHAAGHSWERLELLGLEYRFVAQYLNGQIKSRNDLFQKLHTAIAQFAKRQETWFRRMERRGRHIHWISRANVRQALDLVKQHSWQT